MAVIKMQMPDESPKGRRRLANAKGQKPDAEPAKTGPQESLTKRYADSARAPSPSLENYFSKMAQGFGGGGGGNIAITPPGFFSPMHTPQNWQIAQKRKEIYQWARFYYENEPKVAAGVDFYAHFPMNGFELECKNRKIRLYYEDLVDKLKLTHWLRLISHEYFLLGDVFPFLEIECKLCNGSGVFKSKPCNHPDGRFKSVIILNPDSVEVEDSPFPDKRALKMIPDDELKKTVLTQEPRHIYDRIPQAIRALVASGQPIPLSLRSASHIKHSECPYGKYGTSMLRRLFTILAYKTKLMTANWIVAERLILPVRVVKIGDKERPAGPDDIADMQNQLAAVANDPNLTIVTHHAFDYEWYGASGKIHNIQGEWELIGKEVLDGLMLNQALLNGEMGGYSSAQIGVETLIRRLEGWRTRLSEWIEDHIFRPTAMMQGFVDEEATKELGKTVYLYPTVKWGDMQLRDKTNKLQMFMQLHDKSLISTERLLEEFDIDYDQETERLRNQALMQPPPAPMGAPGSPMGGAVGAPGGGAPPMDPAAGGMAPPPPGGAPGGAPPMGGAPMGGPPMGGAPMGAAAGGDGQKVYKKGKAPKGKDEEEPIPPQVVKLTRIEQKLWKCLQELKLPFRLYGQFQQKVHGQQQPFIMDFALPDIQVDIEADGRIWHEKEGAKEKNAERDRKLAAYGWRVLRFNEDAINERMDQVQAAIEANIREAAEERFSQRKKASSDEMLKDAGSHSVVNEYISFNDSGYGQVIRGVNNLEDTIQFEPDENGRVQEDQGSRD